MFERELHSYSYVQMFISKRTLSVFIYWKYQGLSWVQKDVPQAALPEAILSNIVLLIFIGLLL